MSEPARLTLDEQVERIRLAKEMREQYRIAFFRPYPKQRAFFELTRTKREAALVAANQYGKTDAGAYLGTAVMTGLYPKGWAAPKPYLRIVAQPGLTKGETA